MGTFPLSNACGMSAAIAMLDRSLDPGRYACNVQYGVILESAVNYYKHHSSGCGKTGGLNWSLPTQDDLSDESVYSKALVFSVYVTFTQAGQRDPNARQILTIEEIHVIGQTLE
jgi:hypothetical protein